MFGKWEPYKKARSTCISMWGDWALRTPLVFFSVLVCFMGILAEANFFPTFFLLVLAIFATVKKLESLCPLPFDLMFIHCRRDFILFLKPNSGRLGFL